MSYVQKLFSEPNPDMEQNAGKLIANNIHDELFAKQLAELLVNTKKAGNIFVVAQKTSDNNA